MPLSVKTKLLVIILIYTIFFRSFPFATVSYALLILLLCHRFFMDTRFFEK